MRRPARPGGERSGISARRICSIAKPCSLWVARALRVAMASWRRSARTRCSMPRSAAGRGWAGWGSMASAIRATNPKRAEVWYAVDPAELQSTKAELQSTKAELRSNEEGVGRGKPALPKRGRRCQTLQGEPPRPGKPAVTTTW